MPSRAELVEAYEFLQFLRKEPVSSLDLGKMIKWAQWSRLDARLAELLVRFIGASFHLIDPFQFWRVNSTSAVPQALAVLLEFVRIELKNQDRSLREFEVWSSAAIFDLRPAAPQMFFLREGNMRPDLDFREIEGSLKIYRKWGFFGSDLIVTRKDGAAAKTMTFLNKEQRAVILQNLLGKSKKISVDDYINASGGKIHRRTAERDLEEKKGIKRSGFTRARTYALGK